jgi:hypothetical protein
MSTFSIPVDGNAVLPQLALDARKRSRFRLFMQAQPPCSSEQCFQFLIRALHFVRLTVHVQVPVFC